MSASSRRLIAGALVVLVVLVLSPVPPAHAQTAATPEARRAAFAVRLTEQLADFARRVAPREVVESRSLGYAALASLALGDGSLAPGYLRRVFAAQVVGHGDAAGSVPWNVGPSRAEDFNATEFAVQSWGPILALYGERLPPDLRAELIAHARAAIPAVRRHVVDLSYDNIVLMRAANLILLGNAVGDAAARADGVHALTAALDWRDKYGIHEFSSPTYYGVDLDVLTVGYRATAKDAEAHALFARALDRYWSDIAAQWDDAAGRLAGAHSRDYDFLHGHGGIDNYLYLAGKNAPPFGNGPGYVLAYVGIAPGGYEPHQLGDPALTAPRRAVAARYGELAAQTRYTWFEPGISLGTASFDYNYHDKLVNIAFADADALPEITVEPEPDGIAPYGASSRVAPNGDAHASHAQLFPAIAQRDGAALMLFDLDASSATRGFATNVVLPAAATIAVDGHDVHVTAGLDQPLTTTSVVTVRHGGTVAALRVFHGERCDGGPQVIALRAETDGIARGALRIAVINTAAEGGRRCAAVRVGLLVRVGQAADEAALRDDLRGAQVEDRRAQASDGWKWRVAAAFAGHRFVADEDIDRHLPLQRTVDGAPMPDDAFRVWAGGQGAR